MRGFAAPTSLPNAYPTDEHPLDELRILIVEDDRTLLRLCELRFNEFTIPHRLFLAANGYQGLLLAGKYCPHLIITDLKMPEINELQLIQEIKKTADMKGSKIIVATGLETADIMKMGVLPEDVMILPKPMPFQTIETILYQQACVLLNHTNMNLKKSPDMD